MRVPHNKLSFNEVKDRVKSKFGDNVEILDFINSKNIVCKSNVCGHIYTKSLQNLMKGRDLCPDCERKDRSFLHLNLNDFYCKYKEFAEKYEVVGKWITSQDITTLKCRSCLRKWNVRPYNVAIGKSGCPYCGDYTKTNIDTLYMREKLKDTDFRLLSSCSKNSDYIKILHNKCGLIFTKKVNIFLKHPICPDCRIKSYGEEKVFDTLVKYNIKFKRECAFSDLRGLGGGYLRYDFGIYLNDKLKFFIEYDGIQHSEECHGNYFKDDFKKRQTHDRIKDKYCEDNGYILLRIPHNKRRTVEKVVINFLIKHKLIPSQACREISGRCND